MTTIKYKSNIKVEGRKKDMKTFFDQYRETEDSMTIVNLITSLVVGVILIGGIIFLVGCLS